jgi:hypothetical protein
MRKKTKKILLGSLYLVLGILIVVIAVRAWFDGRAQEKLDRVWGSLGRSGNLVPLRTLLPPVTREDDNAARLWKAAENVFLMDNKDRTALQKAEQALQEWKIPDPEIVAAVEALAARNRLTMDLIREAAGKSAFRYNLLWGPAYDRPWDLRQPNLVALGHSFRLIRTLAALAAESGRPAEALDLWNLETRLLLLMRRDLPLFGSRALINGMKAQVSTLNRIVAGRDLTEKDLRALLDRVRVEPWQEEFRFALRFETESQSQLWGRLIEDPDGAPAWERETSPHGPRGWLFRPVLKSVAVWTLEKLEKVAGWADQSPYEIEDYLGQVAPKTPSRTPRSFRLYFGEDADSISTSSDELKNLKFRFDLLSAWLTAARLGIAGRIHFLRHGAYPASLAELDRDILGEMPVDPYTGRALVYKAGQTGFSIYSVGPNGRDEEGRCVGSLRLTSFRSADDDCVWTEIRPSPRSAVRK